MPEYFQIRERAKILVPHDPLTTEVLRPNQIWRGRELGASFDLSRLLGLLDDMHIDYLSLQLRGRAEGQDVFISEFREALGDPMLICVAKRGSRPFTMMWDYESSFESQGNGIRRIR